LNQAHAQSASRLQPLLNDTVAQFKLVYRQDVDELRRRYEDVSKAVAAWREADRTDENNRRLEAWLRSAIRSSMPGSHESLPPLPTFENLPAPTPPATRAPERSLFPASPAGELPTTPTLRAPIVNPTENRPQSDDHIPSANIEANKPVADKTVTNVDEPAADQESAGPTIEPPASNNLPDADDLPEIEAAPPIDELPVTDELPEIEDDPAMIEALGDPFVDDPESGD
jgi:hypothetical protein